MPADPKPSVRRRVLGRNLRRLREEKGLFLDRAAEQLSCYPSKVSRIESGKSPVRPLDLKALLDLYGVNDEAEREGWLSIARESRERRWWQAFEGALPQDLLDLVGLEEDSSHCRAFQPGVVDPLLQTPEYAEAVIGERGATAELEVVLERQKALTRSEDPVTAWVVLGEAALRQQCGGPAVLRGQLRHLGELSRLPNVTLQVVPYSAGAYRGGPFPFRIYRFPEPSTMEVVALESHMSHAYLELPDEVGFYADIFDRLRSTALGETESRALIENITE
jgi:transcriptional regulator with XRE-family HTH domain